MLTGSPWFLPADGEAFSSQREHGAHVHVVGCAERLYCCCLLGRQGRVGPAALSCEHRNKILLRILIGRSALKTPDILQNSWKKYELQSVPYFHILLSNTLPQPIPLCAWKRYCSLTGPGAAQQVSDRPMAVLSVQPQPPEWLWPAHLSPRCFHFPLGSPLWCAPLLPAASCIAALASSHHLSSSALPEVGAQPGQVRFLSSLIFCDLEEFLQRAAGKSAVIFLLLSAVRCQCDNNHDAQRLF